MIERERKFLVHVDRLPWFRMTADVVTIHQGYYAEHPAAIRASINSKGKARVCFKLGQGGARHEFEYAVPPADATALVNAAPARIVKQRFTFDGWEVDRFGGVLTGLFLAEYEEAEGKGAIPSPLPEWIDCEVTSDPRYSNSWLAFHGTPACDVVFP